MGVKKTLRTTTFVASEYTTHWQNVNAQWEPRLALSPDGPLVLKNIDFTKSSVEALDQFIKKSKPKKVLELGSGNGLITLSLWLLNPEINFTGVELTDEGVKRSKNAPYEYDASLLAYLTGFEEQRIKEKLKLAGFPSFTVGDIAALPFKNNSFDFVFSHTVLEQMPHTYKQALTEASRVTNTSACFIEEFKEAQKNIWQRISLYVTDYFHASYKELTDYHFNLISFETKRIDKASHSVGIVLCCKT